TGEPPLPITYGFIFSVPEVVTFGSFVTYACHEGFVLIGPEISACTDQGWSQPPICIPACPSMLPVFEHAFPLAIRDPPYMNGDLIRYECEECFALAPGCDNIISCDLGAWKNEIQCVRECINPLPTIPNAMPLDGYSPPHLASDTVVYECQDGFVMNSCGPNYVTCQADGEWSDGPSCIPDCKMLLTLKFDS
ncbi:CFAH-like protein, partial [Mya arenaria]